jgi:hypothetical protein
MANPGAGRRTRRVQTYLSSLTEDRGSIRTLPRASVSDTSWAAPSWPRPAAVLSSRATVADRRGRLTGVGDVEWQGEEGVTGVWYRFRDPLDRLR